MVNPEELAVTFRIPYADAEEVIKAFENGMVTGKAGDFMPVLEMVIKRGFVTAWNMENAKGEALPIAAESLKEMEYSHLLTFIRLLRKKLSGGDLPN